MKAKHVRMSTLKLLTVDNPKLSKGEGFGYLSGILYLAPANTSGVANVCPMSTEGCRQSCLFTSGKARVFPNIVEARIRKTRWLYADRPGFLRALRKDIRLVCEKAKRVGLTPAIRVNGT